MSERPDREFQRKAHFDLWLHQNQLFWSRFQLLYIVQASFFVIIATIRSERLLVYVALGVTLIFMAWLYSTLDQDRRLRNFHARKLKDDYGFDPLPPEVTTPERLSPQILEIAFQISIFLPFVVMDIYVAYWGIG